MPNYNRTTMDMEASNFDSKDQDLLTSPIDQVFLRTFHFIYILKLVKSNHVNYNIFLPIIIILILILTKVLSIFGDLESFGASKEAVSEFSSSEVNFPIVAWFLWEMLD